MKNQPLQSMNNKKETLIENIYVSNLYKCIESTSQVVEPEVGAVVEPEPEVPEPEIKVIAKSEESGGIV